MVVCAYEGSRVSLLQPGGGNADRLRRDEEKVARKQRRVPPTRHPTPRPRRTHPRPGHPPIPLRTRAARRSHPQEKETAVEGSDGEHSAPPPRVGARPRVVALLTSAFGSSSRPVYARPAFFFVSMGARPGSQPEHEDRHGRHSVHLPRGRASSLAA